jgi:Ca-activated chloride channel family protein
MSTALEVALASILVFTSSGGAMSWFGSAVARRSESNRADDLSAKQERNSEPATNADRHQDAQASPRQAQFQAGRYNIKLEVNSVLLNVSVRDRRTNRTIPNLGKDVFLVYEDGVLQQVEQVITGDAPFYPLLLLDNSGSTRKFLPLMKEAAIDFVDQLKANDQVAVATFNSLIKLERDFTDDHAALAKVIERIDPIGGTAFYDALLTCIHYYFRGITGRTAIVAFTDGVDNQLEGPNSEGSHSDFSRLYRRVQEVGPIIYLVFLDTRTQAPVARTAAFSGQGLLQRQWPLPGKKPQQKKPSQAEVYAKAQEQLHQIADQTGGRMYYLTSIQDLPKIYSEIVEDLRIQYLLAYTPTHHTVDGKWHEIRVQVKNHTEAAVRTRKGYYAQSALRSPQ